MAKKMKKILSLMFAMSLLCSVVFATVTDQTQKVTYIATNGQTVFNYTWRVLDDDDMDVFVDDVLTTAYSVSGVGNATGGNVTFNTGRTTGEVVFIIRNMPLVQGTQYPAGGRLSTVNLELNLDNLTMLVQDISEETTRAIKLPGTSTLTDIEFPEGTSAVDRASKVITWNILGTGLQLATHTPTTSSSVTWRHFANLAEADQGIVGSGRSVKDLVDAIGASEETIVFVPGTYTFSTTEVIPSNITLKFQQGAVLSIATGVTLTINGNLETGMYKIFTLVGTGRVSFNPGAVSNVHPEWWIANTTPGTTDMTTAIQSAIDSSTNVSIKLLDTTYFVSSQIVGSPGRITIEGVNRKTSIIKIGAGFTDASVFLFTAFNPQLRHWYLDMTLASATNIIGIYCFDARSSKIYDLFIEGNSVDGVGIQYDKGAGVFTGFHSLDDTYITSFKNDIYYASTVTASSITNCDLIGFQSPVIPGSQAIKVDPSSGEGSTFINNEIEGWAIGVYSEGVKIAISTNRFENCTSNITLVLGAGNARIWSQIFGNQYYSGTVDYTNPVFNIIADWDLIEGFRIYGRSIHMGDTLTQQGSSSTPCVRIAQEIFANVAAGDYVRIGTITFTANGNSSQLHGVVSTYRNGRQNAGEIHFILNLVQFPDNLGVGDPRGVLTQWGNRSSGYELSAVITTADSGSSVIELWMKNVIVGSSVAYDIYNTGTLLVSDLSGTSQAALPSGNLISGSGFKVVDSIVAEKQINLKEMTTPTAVANYGAIYTKTDDTLYFQDGAGVESIVIINKGISTLANDATPSVANGRAFITGGTTTITDFDDGIIGKIIYIVSEHAITITDGTNIFLSGSANFVMAATDTLTLIQKADTFWYELGRSVN